MNNNIEKEIEFATANDDFVFPSSSDDDVIQNCNDVENNDVENNDIENNGVENNDAENNGVENNPIEGNDQQEEDVLNYNDTDENEIDDKIYIISIDGIPFYYEDSLVDAKNQVLRMSNNFVEILNNKYGPGHIFISDCNLKQVKIIAPYNFLMLTYNYLIHHITIDYVIKLVN